jgi:hypothetical protein
VPFGADQVEGRNLIAGQSVIKIQRRRLTLDIHRILETREARSQQVDSDWSFCSRITINLASPLRIKKKTIVTANKLKSISFLIERNKIIGETITASCRSEQ